MPSIKLTQAMVDTAPCSSGKQKTDYFDTELTGLVLKVMSTGKRTYYLRYRDTHNRQKEKKLFDAATVSLKQARHKAKAHLSQLATGTDPFIQQQEKHSTPTFSAFINKSYLPYIEASKKSWKVDEAMFRLHIVPSLGKLYLDEITKKHLVDLVSGHSKTFKPSSTNRMINVLHRMFNCALEWEVPGVETNPMAVIKKRKEDNQRDRYLSPSELKALWTAVQQSESEMLPYIVRMLVLTGARKNEVANAKWADIDWHQCQWRIPENKSGQVRYVPLSNSVIKMLKSMTPYDGCEYIFPNPKTLKAYKNFYHSWHTARVEAGVPDIRIHDLRHTYASYLVNIGVSLYQVQKILGHANFATTQRYAHLNQETLLEATNLLAGHVEESIRSVVHDHDQIEKLMRIDAA